MNTEKVDLRVRHTKQVLKDALTKILRRKSIDQITVTELCKTAGINRNTFYSHYSSPASLMEEIEQRFCDELIEQVMEPFSRQDYYTMLRQVCEFIYQHRDISEIVIMQKFDDHFVQLIFNACSEYTTSFWTSHGVTAVDYQFLFRYMSGGSYALIREWITSGYAEDPAVFADRLAKVNLAIANQSLDRYEPIS